MSFRSIAAFAAVVVVTLTVATSADAVTIGEVAASDPGAKCGSIKEALFIVQTASTGASYAVPSGGGVITSWSTSFGSPGAQIALVVLRPGANPNVFTLVGADAEALPSPIPATHVSTFPLATPIVVQAGDLLGVQVPGSSPSACFYETGSAGDVVRAGLAGNLVPGSAYSTVEPVTKDRANVSAEVAQSVDLGLTQTITPSPAASGGVALIALGTTSGVPGVPATVSDVVPGALPVLAAGTAGGKCAVAGQAVTCTVGAGTSVDIVVGTPTPGSYTNQALLESELADANPANNVAGSTITVSAPLSAPAPVPPTCTVIALAKAPLNVAQTALRALHCGIGKVRKASSKTIAKGLVISTTPKAGTVAAAGTLVGITVSSGKPKKKKSKKH